MLRDAITAQGADVHFDAPVPTGGRAPYNVACEPGSSSIFPVGESTVRCTATDADTVRASCEFSVAIRVPRTISKTKFMAFGDSITAGAVSLAPLMMLGPPDTYPFKLEQMLLARYPAQTIVVSNRGFGGEHTRDGARRLPQELDANPPEVLLLLEGINNINGFSTSVQVDGLRSMIADAQLRRIDVIIATVMPMLPTSRLYRVTTPDRIQALNAQIFNLAAQYNLGVPVDLFAMFDANPELIGADGLHPTVEGQTRIAEAFRDEIVRRYDVSSTTSLRFPAMERWR
jgi:lysophospholipase L1-like esterase